MDEIQAHIKMMRDELAYVEVRRRELLAAIDDAENVRRSMEERKGSKVRPVSDSNHVFQEPRFPAVRINRRRNGMGEVGGVEPPNGVEASDDLDLRILLADTETLNGPSNNGEGQGKTQGMKRSRPVELEHESGRTENGAAVVVTDEHEEASEDEKREGGQVRYMNMAREVDYEGTRNFQQRVKRVAEATADGIVNATHVAEVLIRDGKSKSTLKNLRGTVLTELKDGEDFRYVGRGTYMYVPHAA